MSNSSVTATGMEVTANVDSNILMIDIDNDPFDNATGTVALEGMTADSLTASAWETAEGVGPVASNPGSASTVSNWYTAKSTLASEVQAYPETRTPLTTFVGYVLTDALWLGVPEGSGDFSSITVTADFTALTEKTNLNPITILLVSGDKYVELTPESKTDSTLIGELTNGSTKRVDVYIYYDGNHKEAMTANSAVLGGASIVLTFDGTAAPTT